MSNPPGGCATPSAGKGTLARATVTVDQALSLLARDAIDLFTGP
jgi:hypothetical protein